MRWKQLAQITLLAGLLAIAGLAYWLHWGFTIDDAAISFSYARSFSEGFGLGALYPGASRVEGYSNLLWVILLAIATWLGANTLSASKVLGLLFSLGTVSLLFLSLNLVVRSKWLLAGVALVPLSLTFSFWSASGLENSLYGFLIVLSVFFLLREEIRPAGFQYSSALVLILVGMTRPDGILYALAGLVYKTLQAVLAWITGGGLEKRLLLHRLLAWSGILLLGYFLYYAWRIGYFAYPLPNPVYAKSGWFGQEMSDLVLRPQGWVYLRGYFRTFAVVSMLPAMIFGALASLRGPQRIFILFALSSLALPLFSPDWMLNYRFLYPFVPLGAALLVLAGQQLWDWISSSRPYPVWLRILSIGLALWFAYGVARYAWANIRLTEKQLACGYEQPWAEYRCLDGKNYWSMAEVNSRYVDLPEYARRLGLIDPVYLIPDIGATSYLQNLRLLDLGGLADVNLARARDHQVREQYLFSEERPDFIVTHSIWTRRTDLTALSRLWDNYLPVETNQDKNGVTHGTFIRRDLILPEAAQIPEFSVDKKVEMAPGLSLIGITAPDVFAPGVSPLLETFWKSTTPQERDLDLQLRLVTQNGQTHRKTSLPLGYGWHPTSHWQPGETLRQAIRLPEDLSEGDYVLEIQLVDSSDQPVSPAVTSYPFSVDQQAANRRAAELTIQAEALAAAGNPQAALDIFRQSANISGVTDHQRIDLINRQAQLDNLAKARRQLSLAPGSRAMDLTGLLDILYQNRDLQARQLVLAEWKAFSRELVRAAAQAYRRDDNQTAYYLYLSACLADPTNSWAQRQLEETRRLYLGEQTAAQGADFLLFARKGSLEQLSEVKTS